ncbi:MAG: type II toxin-antitoxin system RelE/ParE family toxin [Clostridia bacterium]|nr:type II toxin-antitoxin system RelE/ParE family toxin [Clostridia bacterium]
MSWERDYLPEAKEDLAKLDQPVQKEVLRGIRKVSQNPEYPNGYGKPLGNHAGSNLAGLYKIKLKKAGIRVVYALRREAGKMMIIIVSARADDLVYREAENRRRKYDL